MQSGKNADVSGPVVCALQDPGNKGEVFWLAHVYHRHGQEGETRDHP